jgi:hypothetical protein
MQRRFRFEPARKVDGTPMSMIIERRMVWHIPKEGEIAYHAGDFVWSVTASKDGVSDCKADVTFGQAFTNITSGLCERTTGQLVDPALLTGSEVVRVTHIMTLLPDGSTSAPPQPAGAPVLDQVADVDISLEGRVTSCRMLIDKGQPPPFARPYFRNLCAGLHSAPTANFPSDFREVPGPRRARVRSMLIVEPQG